MAATKKILYCQKVNSAYPFGTDTKYLLMEKPSPSDLGGTDLDFEEKPEFGDMVKTLQIDKIFVYPQSMEETLIARKVYEGTVRVVSSVSIASIAGTTYFDNEIFDLGLIDANGNFTSYGSATATPHFMTTAAVYQTISTQVFIPVSSFTITGDKRLALRKQLYGHVGGRVSEPLGKMKFNLSRGLADSYLEIYLI